MKIDNPASLAHADRPPLFSHLPLPDAQAGFTADDQLKLLVHELGHYLGAVHSSQPDSVMRPKYFDNQAGAAVLDPVNALVTSLVGDESAAARRGAWPRCRGARGNTCTPSTSNRSSQSTSRRPAGSPP